MVEVVYRQPLPASATEAFGWHAREGAFRRLLPPWERAELIRADAGLREGAQVELRQHLGPLRLRWKVEHGPSVPGERFEDVQQSGPFRRWRHVHSFEPQEEDGCVLEDRVEYELPGGPLAQWIAGGYVRRKLDRLFAHRHRITETDLRHHGATKPMRIAVSGASGLIGTELLPLLSTGGHEVRALVRPGSSAEGIRWDPAEGPDPADLSGLDAVIHLAGENIGDGKWTEARKASIRASRVGATRKLAEAIASATDGPDTLVVASAVGWYGDRGDELLTEESAPGSGFLPELCREWEEAADAAREAGVRVVHLRFGVVLSPKGGALAKMLTPFRLGLGGRVGSGRQYMPWLSIEDALGMILHALTQPSVRGVVNAVAPQAITNAEFTKALGAVLRRPTILPLPAFVVGLLFGEMGKDLLLGGQRVEPTRLKESGYAFRDPEIRGALARVLGKSGA